MIDIREEFETLLKDYGITCLYVHNNQKIKCSCYSELHKTGDAAHKICGGTGFLNVIEKVQTINHGLGSNFEIGDFKAHEIGNTYANLQVFYGRHNIGAKPRDLILLTGFNENGAPFNIVKIYEVTAVDEIRGDRGRIEVNMLLSKARPDLVETYDDIVKSLRKIVNVKGRLFLWQKP